ncbi:MAG: ABC transporter transmembrane domain-containing protein, partial [Ignavibacteria bacterium]|nr:ABC transporter transmembrane domain-containing protein [Ignavibacteria bacterium]
MNRRKIYFRVLKYVRPYWRHAIGVFVCAILFSLFSGLSIYLTIPLLETIFQSEIQIQSQTLPTQQLETKIEKEENKGSFFSEIKKGISDLLFSFVNRPSKRESLLRICIVILLAYFLKNAFGYAQSYLMTYIEQGFIRDLRNRTYSHMNRLSLKYFTNERIGNLISRITNDITIINTGISASFDTLIKEPFLIVVFLGIAIMLNWQLTLLSLIVLPFSLVIISWIGVKLYKQSGILQAKMADITSFLQEKIFGIKIVKAFNMQEKENENFFSLTSHFFRIILKITRIRDIASPTTEILSVIVALLIIWYGGIQVLESHTLKASEFIGFLVVIFQL